MNRKSVIILSMILVLSMLLAGCAGDKDAGGAQVEDGLIQIQQSQIPMVHPKKFLDENLIQLTTSEEELAEACAAMDIKPLNVAVFNSNYYQQHSVIAIGIPSAKTNKFSVAGVERSGSTAIVRLTLKGDAAAAVNTNACIFVGVPSENLSGIDSFEIDIQPAE